MAAKGGLSQRLSGWLASKPVAPAANRWRGRWEAAWELALDGAVPMRSPKLVRWQEAAAWQALADGKTRGAAEGQGVAARTLLEAQRMVAKQVCTGIGDAIALWAWPASDGCGVWLDLPAAADLALIAAAIEAENGCAWLDREANGVEHVEVGVAPWYGEGEIDDTVLITAKVTHLLLGLHSPDMDSSLHEMAEATLRDSSRSAPVSRHSHGPGQAPHSHRRRPPAPASLEPAAIPLDSALLQRAAPMGAAPLRYDAQGQVAWDDIWGVDDLGKPFCELAMTGGPSHRAVLLEPATREEVQAEPAHYDEVLAELTRGIRIVTGLDVVPGGAPGWIGVACTSEAMAVWLLQAILAENVCARREGPVLYLPAGPSFRLPYEIKNVITVLAKTHHYWAEHLTRTEP